MPKPARRLAVLLICEAVMVASLRAQSVDPRTASTMQVLSGKGVREYLDGRKATLAALRARLDVLDEKVLMQLSELHDEQQRLLRTQAESRMSDSERVAAEQALAQKKVIAESDYEKILALKDKAEALRTRASKPSSDGRQVRTLKSDIDRLQEESLLLDRAINRNLKTKAAQAIN